MATKQSHNLPDELFLEAALWHTRMHEPEVSGNDQKEFSAWLNRNPQHLDAYAAVERLWSVLDEPVRSLVNNSSFSGLNSWHREKNAGWSFRHAIFWKTALVAGIALAVTVGAWWQSGGLDNLRSDYVTRVGQHESIALTDGSRVILNTDTAVTFAFTAERRTLRMFRGEAYFRIAQEAARPFIVQTSEGETRVVGTEFNVRMMNRRTVVSVFRGQVKVIPESVQPNTPAVHLAAGEEALLSQGRVSQVSHFDATMVTAWIRGQVVFYHTPLEEVVNELNRYHRGRIMIFGEQLKTLRVSGVFDVAKPLEVIDIIERTLGVTATRFSDYVIFLR